LHLCRTLKSSATASSFAGIAFRISGASLAQELGVPLRTLYRDVETLNAQGARIDGEAGVGYVLRPCRRL
jgi:predicted DNA-binding transcriptional regulator YafY